MTFIHPAYLHCQNSIEKNVPAVVSEFVNSIIMKKMAGMESLCLIFYLWMSRSVEDTFEIIFHRIFNYGEYFKVHFAMVK